MDKINRVSILVDNDSWILPYALLLKEKIDGLGISCSLVRCEGDIQQGDICFLLGCTKIVSDGALSANRLNLVVHESALPKGKGFAPMAWQIIDQQDIITFSLIEASSDVDSGDIWIKSDLCLGGHELCDEWRMLQGNKTVEMCIEFLQNFETLKPIKQEGNESFFSRRSPKDSELDINKSIAELFPLLRVVDNSRYPAFFYRNGVKYTIRIEKSNDE